MDCRGGIVSSCACACTPPANSSGVTPGRPWQAHAVPVPTLHVRYAGPPSLVLPLPLAAASPFTAQTGSVSAGAGDSQSPHGSGGRQWSPHASAASSRWDEEGAEPLALLRPPRARPVLARAPGPAASQSLKPSEANGHPVVDAEGYWQPPPPEDEPDQAGVEEERDMEPEPLSRALKKAGAQPPQPDQAPGSSGRSSAPEPPSTPSQARVTH